MRKRAVWGIMPERRKKVAVAGRSSPVGLASAGEAAHVWVGLHGVRVRWDWVSLREP